MLQLRTNIFIKYILFILLISYSKEIIAQWNLPVEIKVLQDGKKLSGAVVTLYKGTTQAQQIITTSSGSAKFQLDQNAEYTISITKPGYINKKVYYNTKGVPEEVAQQGFKGVVSEVTIFEMFKTPKIIAKAEAILSKPMAKFLYDPQQQNIDYDEAYAESMVAALASLRDLQEEEKEVAKKKEEEEKAAAESAAKAAAEKAKADAAAKEAAEKAAADKAKADAEAAKKAAEEKAKAEKEKADAAAKAAAEKAKADAAAKEAAEKAAADKAKADAEAAKKAAEEKAKADAAAKEAAEKERIAKEKGDKVAEEKARLEKERIAKENAEKELAAKKAAEEKAKADAAAKIASEKAAADKAKADEEAAKKAAEEKAKADAAAKEAAEKERIAKEKGDKAAEEKARLEKERLAKENTEKELAAKKAAEEKAKLDAAALAKLELQKNKENQDDEYNQFIAKADGLFNSKKYEEAKSVYQLASDKKPKEKYPRDRIAEIMRLLSKKVEVAIAKQKAELKEEISKNYEEGITEENYSENNSQVLKRTVVRGDDAHVYTRKITTFGPVYFFKDGIPITEIEFEKDTAPKKQ